MNKIIKFGRNLIQKHQAAVIFIINVLIVISAITLYSNEMYLEIGLSAFLFICNNVGLKTIINASEKILSVS